MVGTIRVLTGGSATAIEIGNGGTLSASTGAVLTNDTVLAGGTVFDTGTANNNTGLTITAGGLLDITVATGSQSEPGQRRGRLRDRIRRDPH